MNHPALSAYAASALAGPLLLVLTALLCLLAPLFIKALRGAQGAMALGAALTALVMFRHPPAAELLIFGGALILSPATAWLWALALGVLALTVLLSLDHAPVRTDMQGEYYFLLITACLGLMALVSAGDLFTAFIAMELLSMPLYALAGIRRSKAGLEAAYKYFMLGAFGSCMTVLGIALLNAFYPSLAFAGLMKAGAPDPAALAGFVLVISGFAFKTALVPFHMWVPDVYEGSPTPVAAFMGAAVKAGGAIVLWRIFSLFEYGPVRDIFWWLALITFMLANFAALAQNGLKRLLAYSSVAHAGYMAVAFFGGRTGFAALLYYLPVYAMATTGAFAVALALEKGEKGPAIEDLAGLAKDRPWTAAAMTAFMLSLAGVPPLAGFFAKFYAFSGAVDGGCPGLVAAAVLMSAVSAYYYLRVTVVMYMKPAPAARPVKAAGLTEGVILLMAAGVIAAGFLSGPLMRYTQAAAAFF